MVSRPQSQHIGQRAKPRTRRLSLRRSISPRLPVSSEALEIYRRDLEHGFLLGGHARAGWPSIDEEVVRNFRSLAETWYSDTLVLSSYFEKILHPSYQRILTLGDEAITLILHELQDMPNDCFWALRILTDGVDPVKPAHAGDMQAMADAWLEWGRDEGYI